MDAHAWLAGKRPVLWKPEVKLTREEEIELAYQQKAEIEADAEREGQGY